MPATSTPSEFHNANLMTSTPTKSFILEPDALSRVFTEDADGRLRFGYSAKSVSNFTTADLHRKRVEFQDYVMEGFVKYRLSLRVERDMMMLDVEFLGTTRDHHLEAHIRWQLGVGR